MKKKINLIITYLSEIYEKYTQAYTGKPTPFEKLEHESIKLQFIDSSLKRGTPFKKLILFDGLANTCACKLNRRYYYISIYVFDK